MSARGEKSFHEHDTGRERKGKRVMNLCVTPQESARRRQRQTKAVMWVRRDHGRGEWAVLRGGMRGTKVGWERSKGKGREDNIFQDQEGIQGRTEASCGGTRSHCIRCNACSHAQTPANLKGSLGNEEAPELCYCCLCVHVLLLHETWGSVGSATCVLNENLFRQLMSDLQLTDRGAIFTPSSQREGWFSALHTTADLGALRCNIGNSGFRKLKVIGCTVHMLL